MIPVRDVIPSRTTPVVVLVILAVNTVVFLLALAVSGGASGALGREWGRFPARAPLVLVLASLFMHAGWAQLASNLLFLWIFGENVEDRMGRGRFLLFYLICGSIAGLVHAATASRAAPALGSAGAVAGVMGAYFVLYPRSRVLTLVPFALVETPAVLYLAVWFVLQLLAGPGLPLAAAPGVRGPGLWALAAAFAGGAALVLLFRRPERVRVEWWSDLGSRADRV
jgi:membrane associated rhomboid family serine protease